MDVLVTGASGFIGRALCMHLAHRGWSVRAGVRSDAAGTLLSGTVAQVFVVGTIDGATDWSRALDGVTHVVHLAARAHVRLRLAEPAEVRTLTSDVEGAGNLACAAAASGVRRFVFLSSVKACADRTTGDPLTDCSSPRPCDPYGEAKLKAEQRVLQSRAVGSMQVTILRPPLVYGAGVGGNFERLMSMVWSGLPIPLGSVANRRSLLFVGNLVSAIETCLVAEAAAGQTFFVSDGTDVSTPDLVRRLASAMGTRSRLFAFPPRLLRVFAAVFGRRDQAGRLVDSLQVDGSRIREALGWCPPFSLDEGLRLTVASSRWAEKGCQTRTDIRI